MWSEWQRASRVGWAACTLVLGTVLLAAFLTRDGAAAGKQAPPPPGVAPKFAPLKPVAAQYGRSISVGFPIILPRDPTYPGSGGKSGPLGGRSGRFASELVRMFRAVRCTGRLVGRPGLRQPPPNAAIATAKWPPLRETRTQVVAAGGCTWGLNGRMKLAQQTLRGTFTLNYSAFWTGTPGTIFKQFVIRGMCDRPGCPIRPGKSYVLLKVTS